MERFIVREDPTYTGKARNRQYNKGYYGRLNQVDIAVFDRTARETLWSRDALNSGTTDKCAAAKARKTATAICAALNKLFARSANPSMRKVAEFVDVHPAECLPLKTQKRFDRAREYQGPVADVIGVYGYAGVARDIIAADGRALDFRARLIANSSKANERHLVLLDRAIDQAAHGEAA